jgi:hypothetical protein
MAPLVWIISSVGLIGPAVYYMLPCLACWTSRQLADSRLNRSAGLPAEDRYYLISRMLPARWRIKISIRLQRAGYFSGQALAIYLFLLLIPVPAMTILGLLSGLSGGQAALAGIMLITLVNTCISRRIAARQKAFTKALFKIYRFLDQQLTAGIKITDSLKGLPEAVEDKTVHPVLLRFAALFELTLNLEKAFGEIRMAFRGTDSELLATHLGQCLQTGEAGRSLFRMEELLFSRYFNLMQAETQRIRFHLLLTAVLGILPGLILFMYPLISQAISAMQSVFG